MPSQLIRLFHTARHLRFEQIHGRICQRVRANSDRSTPSAPEGSPSFPGCRWAQGRAFLPPANIGLDADDIRRGCFRFLNTTERIGFPPHWGSGSPPRLWQYNLHYFDWLWRLDFDAARHVASDWIVNYRNGRDKVGWESYPTSVRLMNWCGFFFGRHRSETLKDAGFCEPCWRGLYQQCQWLARHVERHLLNNHTLENGAALAFVGSCFRGDAAERWLERGSRILAEQLRTQILSDGMHFELSPMYQCRVLHVLKLLLDTDVGAMVALVREPVQRMSQALGSLAHPDGRIALFSDSAVDVYHEPSRLYAETQAESGCFSLPEAGYYGWRGQDGTYLIADYGPIGPDHNPGHGHADIFSFELSLNGCRVVTDSGVHDYEESPLRRYCRSTAAHNTVEIAGQDQCELWGAFRVARRGYPREVRWDVCEDGFVLSAWHDGYQRLAGKPIHQRRIEWDRARGLFVEDRIQSRRYVDSVSRLHLHPDCQVVGSSPRSVVVSYPAGTFRVEANADIQIEQTAYCERFYETVMRPCLCLASQGESVELTYRIKPLGQRRTDKVKREI